MTRFKPDEIPKEDIYDIVRAACLAPSARNKQMWCFIAISNNEALKYCLSLLEKF